MKVVRNEDIEDKFD